MSSQTQVVREEITFGSFHDRAFFFLFPRLLKISTPLTAHVILRPLHQYTFSSAIYSDSTQGDSPTPTSSRARLGKISSSGTRRDHPPRAHLLLAAKTPVLRVLALLSLTSSPHVALLPPRLPVSTVKVHPFGPVRNSVSAHFSHDVPDKSAFTSPLSIAGPSNPIHREAVCTTTLVLCKDMLRPGQSVSLGVCKSEVGCRVHALARLERVWEKGGASTNESTTQLASGWPCPVSVSDSPFLSYRACAGAED